MAASTRIAIWIAVVGLLGAFCPALQAQNRFLISQYMYNGMVLNPAYAGSQQLFSLSLLNRQQWVNVDGAPVYQLLSAHTPLADNRIGIGTLLTRESIGVHHDFSAYASCVYKIKIQQGYIGLGLSGGVSYKNSFYSQLIIKDIQDSYLRTNTRRAYPNFGVGGYFYNNRWYAGVSVPYILNQKRLTIQGEVEPEVISIEEPRSYYLTAGALFGHSDIVKLNPSTLIRIRDRLPISLDANLNFILYERVLFGTSYRIGNGLVLLSQFILNENFRLMYSYDLTTSRLSKRASGTHELMFNYRIKIEALERDPFCSAYF